MAWLIRHYSRINTGLDFRGHTGCIICNILYSEYRVCIQAQTLCIYIYRRLYIYTQRQSDAFFFTLIFRKKPKGKAISMFLSHFASICLQLYCFKTEDERSKGKKPALWQIQRILSIDPSRLWILREHLVLDVHQTPVFFSRVV